MTSTVWTAAGALLAGVAAFVPVGGAAGAQVAIKRGPAGFNLFTVQQDADIGRQAATEIERQVALVTSARTAQFLGSITAVVAQASGARIAFEVKAINSGDVNLYVLPGGQIYVTRGLLSQARSEAAVAAVLAHGMAPLVIHYRQDRASQRDVTTDGL